MLSGTTQPLRNEYQEYSLGQREVYLLGMKLEFTGHEARNQFLCRLSHPD
jgi:hypothetical protein